MENKQSASAYVVQDGSEVGKLIHTYDWSSTPLGAYPSWPKTLQFSLNMLLHANLPMVLFWGDHSFCFYNDAFLQLLPEKAKRASVPGKAAADAWAETGAIVKPAIDQVRRTGKAISYDDDTSPLSGNNGHAGHYHHYSPIHDEAGVIAGVLLICSSKAQEGAENPAVSGQNFQGIIQQAPAFINIDGGVGGELVNANDVSDQVLARKRLEESELRFRALVTATSDAVYRMNPDWTEMQSLVGRGFLTDMESPAKDWLERYIHPDDRKHVRTIINKAVETQNVFELEHQVFRLDGTIGWTFSRAIPIRDEAGNIIEWFGAASDITQRKKFEQELQTARDELHASKRLYDAVTGSTPDLMYVFDLNYKFIYANQALLNMWGRNWKDSIGKSLLEVGYEPWHATMHEREIDQVIATKKQIRGEVGFPHAVMGYRMYDYIFAPVFNEHGEVEAIAGTTRDISDLKVAELALKHSEEQFRTLTQSLPQLIWTADIHGSCDFFNHRWYDYTGCPAEDIVGTGWMMYVHPDHREQLYDKWQKSIKSGEPLTFEFQLKSRNGNYQWFYNVSNPIKGEKGEILKWVSALSDIQKQKAVKEKLEQLVNERTGALQRSNDDLEQFAHVASHDLKEPVRKIKTFADRLEHDEGTALSEKGKSYLNKINTAANRMYDMIEGVLNYSSVDNTVQTFTRIDLNETIRSIELDLEVLMNQKNAHLTYKSLPTLKGVPVLIYQLFYNLISNSLKFTHADTPPLVSITAGEVVIGKKSYLQIDVKDNGIGFDQEHAGKIFDSFIRLNSKDKYEGTGLGLALCKKIVLRHHGFIAARSLEEKGAVFTILLPKEQETN